MSVHVALVPVWVVRWVRAGLGVEALSFISLGSGLGKPASAGAASLVLSTGYRWVPVGITGNEASVSVLIQSVWMSVQHGSSVQGVQHWCLNGSLRAAWAPCGISVVFRTTMILSGVQNLLQSASVHPAQVMKNRCLPAAVLVKMEGFSCRFCTEWSLFPVGCAGFLPRLVVLWMAALTLGGSVSPEDCRVPLGDQALLVRTLLAWPGFTCGHIPFSLHAPGVFWSASQPRCTVPAVGLSAHPCSPCSDASPRSLTIGLEHIMEIQKSII